MDKWIEFRVDDDECNHLQDVYEGCPLCANGKLQAEIDEYRHLLDAARFYTEGTELDRKIDKALIEKHKGE